MRPNKDIKSMKRKPFAENLELCNIVKNVPFIGDKIDELTYNCNISKGECILPKYCSFFEYEQGTCKYLRGVVDGTQTTY